MDHIINLLPDATANQIAAGEVVQRPASVVKELLENAVDAGAENIQVVVKEAGKTFIRISDDGAGMNETDARMAFERHATSKIRSSDELFSLTTMGFRGEALASIAAVAQVELKTKQEGEETGTYIRIEGSELKEQEPTACNKGTSITVKNLFYNVPARRNFLKSNAVEMSHILEEFKRVALSFLSIKLLFYQNDMETFNLPPSRLSQRIVNIFGKNYREQLIPCQEESSIINIKGYIGKPEYAKKTRGEQYFFVNNRYMKNNYFNHAVMNAYEGMLPENSFPFYVLFLEIDPAHIDVNIHPTKTEVKFEDEKSVYAIIQAAVKKALGSHNITPSLDFNQSINLTTSSGGNYSSGVSGGSGGSQPPRETPQETRNRHHWENLFREFEDENRISAEKEEQQLPNRQDPLFSSRETAPSSAEGTSQVRWDLSRHEAETDSYQVFQLHEQYIISQIKSGMMIMDQQAGHERILYEKYLQSLENRKEGVSQQFLFSKNITLDPADFTLVKELNNEIRALGFDFDYGNNNTIVIKGIPADLNSGNEKELFEGFVEQMKHNQDQLKLGIHENLARALARKTSVKSGTQLSDTEMAAMINQLFACNTPMYSPDGKPTVITLDLNKISSYFGAE